MAENPRRDSQSVNSVEGPTGFVLADLRLKPVYANRAAIRILSCPARSDPANVVQRRLQTILGVERCSAGLVGPKSFLSGNRPYICRVFLLKSPRTKVGQSAVALLIEPEGRMLIEDVAATASFRLSPRERETVHNLTLGLTNKEIAEQMAVSPHTVKQFVRQIMGKVGVTTRSGIVGKAGWGALMPVAGSSRSRLRLAGAGQRESSPSDPLL